MNSIPEVQEAVKLRKKAKVTMSEVSEQMGVAESHICRLETTYKNPGYMTVKRYISAVKAAIRAKHSKLTELLAEGVE